MGLLTETFPSSEAFLKRLPEPSKRDGLRHGCLVLDIRLTGISGPELYETLVAGGFETPTILVSGHFDVEQESLPNCLARLEKPYSGSELTRWV